MKNLFLIFIFLWSSQSFAQWPVQICNEPLNVSECIFNDTVPDYKTALFNYVITRDVYLSGAPKFGKNPMTSNPSNFVDLKLDVYLPCNNESLRPVVLVPRASHYSSLNGVSTLGSGGKYRYILRELARKGYVAVGVEYRSYTKINSPGFYVDITPGPSSPIDSCAYDTHLIGQSDGTDHFFRCYKCLIESGYSAEAELFKKWMMYINTQDMLAAVGYCATDPSGLGINADLNNVFIGGMSNGGQVSLTAAYLDDSDYISPIELQVKAALGPIKGLGFATELPADFNFKGAFNLWGSMHDLDHIGPDDPAAYLIHGTWDDTVPYQDNYLGFESNQEESHFYSYGSEAIACRLNQEGVSYGLYSMYRIGHGAFPQIDECTPGMICGVKWSDKLITKISIFMRKLIFENGYASTIKSINPQEFGCSHALSQSLILDLFESDIEGNCIQNPAHLPSSLPDLLEYCNCEPPMSPLIGNSELPAFFKTNTFEKLDVFPNPVNDHVQFQSSESDSMLRIYDSMGVGVLEMNLRNTDDYILIDISKLAPGHYIITTGTRRGQFVKI